MIRYDDPQLQYFATIAFEMRESLSHKGYRVTQAMGIDPCFRSGQARAGLRRDVLKEASSRAASQCGVDFRPMGEGLEFRTWGADLVYRSFRLRSAHRNGADEIVIQHNSQSSLVPAGDQYTIGADETWVLGVVFKSDEELDEVFLSRVIGVTDSKVPHLRLDSYVPLVAASSPPDDFTPDEEDLDIFPDDQEDDGDAVA